MNLRLPFGAATRGFAALAAFLVLTACDDAKPADTGEAGAKVDPVSPPSLDSKKSSEGSSEAKTPEPAPVAKKTDPDPPIAPPKDTPQGSDDPAPPSPTTPEPQPKPTPASGTTTPGDADFTVVDFGVGTGVAGRELQGRATRFTTDVGTLHAWVKIKNDGSPRQIDMIWRKQGVETFRYSLDIGKSPSWRTWSKKTVAKTDSAPWSVQIVSKSGEVLAERSFTIDD